MRAFRKLCVPFTHEGICCVPAQYPIVYRIRNRNGKYLYIGIAHRGRARERLKQHLYKYTGATYAEVGLFHSIASAMENEACLIKRHKPVYNVHHNR